jgi:hypothetical protein
MLPAMDLRPTGKALVQFIWPVSASKAVDKLRGKTSPGIVDDLLECRLVDISRKPFPQLLSHRAPLMLRHDSYSHLATGQPNLKHGLIHSGRAVALSGFPATLHPLSILEKLEKEDFNPIRGPGAVADDNMDEIVQLSGYESFGALGREASQC